MLLPMLLAVLLGPEIPVPSAAAPVRVAPLGPHAVASDGERGYATLLLSGQGPMAVGVPIDADGLPQYDAETLLSGSAYDADVVFMRDAYAVATAGRALELQRVARDGQPLGARSTLAPFAGQVELAWNGDVLVVAWIASDAVFAAVLDDELRTIAPPLRLAGVPPGATMDVAASGRTFAVVWDDGTLRAARIGPRGDAEVLDLGIRGSWPRIAGNRTEYLLVYEAFDVLPTWYAVPLTEMLQRSGDRWVVRQFQRFEDVASLGVDGDDFLVGWPAIRRPQPCGYDADYVVARAGGSGLRGSPQTAGTVVNGSAQGAAFARVRAGLINVWRSFEGCTDGKIDVALAGRAQSATISLVLPEQRAVAVASDGASIAAAWVEREGFTGVVRTARIGGTMDPFDDALRGVDDVAIAYGAGRYLVAATSHEGISVRLYDRSGTAVTPRFRAASARNAVFATFAGDAFIVGAYERAAIVGVDGRVTALPAAPSVHWTDAAAGGGNVLLVGDDNATVRAYPIVAGTFGRVQRLGSGFGGRIVFDGTSFVATWYRRGGLAALRFDAFPVTLRTPVAIPATVSTTVIPFGTRALVKADGELSIVDLDEMLACSCLPDGVRIGTATSAFEADAKPGAIGYIRAGQLPGRGVGVHAFVRTVE